MANGRHEFDGKLPDWSKAGLDQEVARLHSERERAAGFANLDAQQQFERDYVIAEIDADLFWRESARWPYRDPYFYSDSVDPEVYLTRPYAPLDQRMRAFINYEKVLPAALDQVRANLQTPMPRTYVDFGRLTFGGLAQYFDHDVKDIFAPVKDPQLQSEFAAANGSAIRALKSLDAWFASQRAKANDNFALGPDLFHQMLYATERVDISLDQLEAIGRQDLDRNLAALKEACAQFDPGKPLADCTAKQTADKPKGSPLDAAREQLKELRTFVVDNQIVSIPGTEDAQVDEAPPYQRWNFAYINIPGPYEKGLPSVYYISPPDPKWPAAEQKAYLPGNGTLLFTSVHEVMPGHFLQFLHANRVPSRFGQVFVGYAFAEGWAHYVRRNDVGRRTRRKESGNACRAIDRSALARRPIHLRNRPAYPRDDRCRIRENVSGIRVHRRGRCATAGRARHIRSSLPQLHDGQADDSKTARRLDGQPRRPERVARLSRSVPELWRAAHSTGESGNAGEVGWTAALTTLSSG